MTLLATGENLYTCSRCKSAKPETNGHFSFIVSRNKFHAWCKPCCAEDRRRDRSARPEHYATVKSASIARDPEKTKARVRAYYHATKDERREATKASRLLRLDQYNANRREVLKDPARRDAKRAASRAHRAANPELYAAYAAKAWAKATPQRRLRTYFGAAICHSLKGSGKGGRSWTAILGYSADELRAHLERQFTKGMSWDNYGDWHVDHIVPVASFSFASVDDPEFMACWRLSNLRPLWAEDNLTKRAHRLHLV